MASIKFSRKEVEKQLGIKINEEIEEVGYSHSTVGRWRKESKLFN